MNHNEKLQERELERIRCNDGVSVGDRRYYSRCSCSNRNVAIMIKKRLSCLKCQKITEEKDKEYAKLIFLMQDRHVERERNG